MTAAQLKASTALSTPAETILRWMEHPDLMVRELFGATPDAWQDEVLQAFPHSPRLAMKASKGPGKSCVEAWLGWNILLTRPFPNCAATSISGDNLKDGFWKEMAFWRSKAPILERQFELTSQRIYHRAHQNIWWMSARSWAKSADRKTLGDTLAGLHSDYMLFIIDEAGPIPPEILMAAEAGFASAKECHIVMGGNTNSLEGALYHACVKHKSMWKIVLISGDPDDPKRSPRINLEWAKRMVETYGRDNPFIKVTILGEWPSASFNALIGADELEVASRRAYREFQYGGAARTLGVDVARYGLDASVIFPRQGIVAFPPQTLRNVNSVQGAGAVARKWREWDADACFIDMTGGFGAGWYDQLQVLGFSPIGVQFAGEAHDKKRYANKRTEIYMELADWIRAGGQIPADCPELIEALSQTNYTFRGDQMILEPKEDIAEKIGHSPDHADALAETFAQPVQAKPRLQIGRSRSNVLPNYDPFKEIFEDMTR